ncbi:MAG: HEPN domain-containing protein [Elusimicrobiota bacterium]
MTIKDHLDYWLNSAEYDFNTALTLFKNKQYAWCLFIGHLVLEKTLKAIWVRDNNNKVPPKTHNLVVIAEGTKLKISDEIKLEFLDINDFNIETRYPDYRLEFYKRCDKKFTEIKFKIIKEMFKWLKEQI